MDESKQPSPYDGANIFSKLTFWWLNPFFSLGFRNVLNLDNIYTVPKGDHSWHLLSKLERVWKREVQNYSEGRHASLMRAVLKAFKWQLIFPGFLIFLVETIKVVQAYLIGLLVAYFNGENDAISQEKAFGVGACLGLSGLLQVVFNPIYFFIMQHVSLRMKVAVGALIYRKVLTLSSEAFHHTSAGQIVNHLSTDVEKFNMTIDFLHYFWISPLSICLLLVLMYLQVGMTCFWALIVVAVIVPLQMGLSFLCGRLRTKIARCADQRIQLVSETIKAMRTIKMQCWEECFLKTISRLRKTEFSQLSVGACSRGTKFGLEELSSRLISGAIFLATYSIIGQLPQPSQLYFIVAVAENLRLTGFSFLPFAFESIVQLWVSLSRIQRLW